MMRIIITFYRNICTIFCFIITNRTFLIVSISHEHNFNVPVMYNGTDILHDDKYHFMKCTSCNLITEQEHTLQPRTFYNSNRHYKECPICNYKTKDCTNISRLAIILVTTKIMW